MFPILGVVVFFVNRPFCSTNSGDPGLMHHYVASHLGLYCLPISSHKKDISNQLVSQKFKVKRELIKAQIT